MENFSSAISFCCYCLIKHDDFFTNKNKCSGIENMQMSNESKLYDCKFFELHIEEFYKSAINIVLII